MDSPAAAKGGTAWFGDPVVDPTCLHCCGAICLVRSVQRYNASQRTAQLLCSQVCWPPQWLHKLACLCRRRHARRASGPPHLGALQQSFALCPATAVWMCPRRQPLSAAMNPNSLFTSKNRKQPTNPHARRLDVEADLKPLLAFLTDTAGFSQEQVVKVRSGRRWSGCALAGWCSNVPRAWKQREGRVRLVHALQEASLPLPTHMRAAVLAVKALTQLACVHSIPPHPP